MADLYLQALHAADSISGNTIDQLAIQSARYTAVRETVEMIADWTPEYIAQEGES